MRTAFCSKCPQANGGAAQKKEIMKNELRHKNPVEIFKMFFTEELMSSIRNQTPLQATKKK